MGDMQRIVVNNYVDATLCALFMAVVIAMIIAGLVSIRRARASSEVSTKEVGYAISPAHA